VTTALRGRDEELGVITEQFDRARAGEGSTILVEGRAGFGKSRLLDEWGRIAGRVPMRAVSAAAEPGDGVVPMGLLMKALFESEDPLLPRTALPDLTALPEQRYWLLQELEALLEQSALRTPLLVCLDDLQWADRGTFAALRVLPRRLAMVPVVWAGAFRPGQGYPELVRVVDELEGKGARRLVLGRLGDAAVEQIVKDFMQAEPSPQLLAIAERARGSPFLLTELLLGLKEEGLVDLTSGRAELLEARVPARIRDTMRQRLDGMSAPARQVAHVASALGRRFSFEDLAAMLRATPSELLQPVEDLTRADILNEADGDLGFRHDIIREAVHDSVPDSARRALDRQAAEVLLAAGALPLEVAARLARSADNGDRVAVTTLHRAAQAIAPTDPATASELSRKALALTTEDDPERMTLVKETALLLHAAGVSGDEAKAFADEALGEFLPPEDEAAVRLSIAAMYTLPAEVRVEAARVALSLPDVSEPLRAHLLATQVLSLVAAGRPDDARAIAREAESAATASGDEGALISLEFGRLALDEADGLYGPMFARADAIRQLGREAHEDAIVRAAEWLLSNALAALGQLDDALALAGEGVASARRDRQGWMAPRWEIWRGRFLLELGRIADASAVLEGVFDDESINCPVTIPDAAGALALARIAIHTGNESLSLRCTKMARAALEVDRSDARRQVTWLLAIQAMARGEPDAARHELGSLGDLARPSILPMLARDVCDDPQLVRLALAARDADMAHDAAEAAEERARLNPDVALIGAVAAHARGLLRDDLTDLARAVDLFAAGPRPLALASALEDLGRGLVIRQRKDAVEALGRAFEIYADTGASWDARRVRHRLRELGVRRRLTSVERPETGWAALTDSELAVVGLVVQGLTNRETADRLYVSPHTVSTHVRHVFTKLNINSRVELTRLAVEHELVDR
jgi:DNA-binding CsgD family transcriptional regulator